MDGLSVVAGVATAGVQLSKSLYDLYSTVRTSRYEIQDVANNVSLLAMVLEELDGVLHDDKLEYRPQLRKAAHSIALRCASIFKDIRKHVGTDREPKGQKSYEKVTWYFKRERVKSLRSSLDSLKSTLNILLHVVQLAKNTKGVEEYPGVKSIGHWYVRRERRGLVYLVIDNRHAVERLEQLEQQEGRENQETIENERPLVFADIFPLSTTTRERGQSPERKFVVAFRNSAYRNDDDSRRSQEPQIDFLQASPRTPRGDRVLLPSPSPQGKSPLHLPTDSDAESICRSASSQSTRKLRMKARATDEQSTSRLILDVIPHETADKALKSAQNMSRSTLLEAKAEETIDLLMRNYTYVGPEYFSEDDRSSISSAEPSISLLLNRNRGKGLEPVERPRGPDDSYLGQGPDSMDNSGFTEELGDILWVSMEGKEASSSLPAGQNKHDKNRPSPTSPACQNIQGNRDAKGRRLSHELSGRAVQSPKEPSTPAPPYSSPHSAQCPSCAAASDSESKSFAEKCLRRQKDGRILATETGDTGTGEETSTSVNSAIKLLETKFLEIMKQYPLSNVSLNAQSGQATEQKEHLQQSIAMEPETEPVILKDCLGRKFLFPIQKCRSWQNMENLIKRSFAHVESMNSKIFRGSYDILGPTGEIILPEIWDSVVKPGWVVELRFWDFPAAGEMSLKGSDLSGVDVEPVVQSSSAATRQSYIEAAPDTQLATAKRRASFRTWLGSRRSTPSVAL